MEKWYNKQITSPPPPQKNQNKKTKYNSTQSALRKSGDWQLDFI